jgi:hypothetical protein
VRDPVLRAHSQGNWEAARRIRIELACDADDANEALRLVIGLKARVLAEELDRDPLDTESEMDEHLAAERAVSIERGLLVELLEVTDRGGPLYIDWELIDRLGESGERLVTESDDQPRVAIDRLLAALDDAERRLARTRDRIAAATRTDLPVSVVAPSLEDLWALLRT